MTILSFFVEKKGKPHNYMIIIIIFIRSSEPLGLPVSWSIKIV